MDVAAFKTKSGEFFQKYKYAALVVLIGIVLLMIPVKKSAANSETKKISPQSQSVTKDELEEVLSQIEGAGRVRVMLTLSAGEKTIYQTDEKHSVSGNENERQINTIIVTDAQRQQNGLVSQVNPAAYLGAIIVCEGADRPAIRLAIVDAVSKVTGLGADRIAVLKMK